MPLIVFTGYPSSGKTTVAQNLILKLQEKIDLAKKSNAPGYNYSITFHSDETLGISHEAYNNSNSEKAARGSQMSAVKRDILRSRFVILDSLAYIKGFRYQLFCEAKGVQTPHCVIYVINPIERCLEWDSQKKKDSAKWNETNIRQLAMRYEEPNGDTRWDSPLFTIAPDFGNDELPIEEIWESLVLKRPPPPNAATVLKPVSGINFVQELDKHTQEVLSKIIRHQQLAAEGGEVPIDLKQNLFVQMPPHNVSTAQLQRIRRTYISLNRMRVVDTDRIVPLFVDYINASLNNDD